MMSPTISSTRPFRRTGSRVRSTSPYRSNRRRSAMSLLGSPMKDALDLLERRLESRVHRSRRRLDETAAAADAAVLGELEVPHLAEAVDHAGRFANELKVARVDPHDDLLDRRDSVECLAEDADDELAVDLHLAPHDAGGDGHREVRDTL